MIKTSEWTKGILNFEAEDKNKIPLGICAKTEKEKKMESPFTFSREGFFSSGRVLTEFRLER